MDFAKSLGADEVVDYQTQDFAQLLQNYDAVFDTVGGETTMKSYAVLKDGGALVSMVSPEDEALASQRHIRYTHQFTQVTTERLAQIAGFMDSGVLHVIVDKVFPLAQAAEALEYLKTTHPRGKVVIKVSEA
jgi:NADPH:quinone reductase-like Zn-dependent oxidoreductase